MSRPPPGAAGRAESSQRARLRPRSGLGLIGVLAGLGPLGVLAGLGPAGALAGLGLLGVLVGLGPATGHAVAAKAKAGAATALARLVPDTRAAVAPYTIQGQAIEVRAGDLLVRVEPLDAAARESYFRARLGTGADPLPDGLLVQLGARVFAISVGNLSEAAVTFVPTLVLGEADRGRVVVPMPADRLVRAVGGGLARADEAAVAELPAALAAFHLEPTRVPSGGRLTGLMVLEGLASRSRRLTVNLRGALLERPELAFQFPFVEQGRDGRPPDASR